MDQNPGMLGGLAQLAYGQQRSPLADVPALLNSVLPSEAPENEALGFGAGVGAPTKTGALTEAFSAGMAGKLEARTTREKLRAQYMPLIMQSIIQSQQMTLSAANAGRDYLKDIIPKVDSHMAALRAGDTSPSYDEAVQRLLQLGQEYQIPPHIQLAKIQSLPRSQEELAQYLDRLAAGTAGAEKLLPSAGQNAAGQATAVSPIRGTVKVLDSPRGPSSAPTGGAAPPANPTSSYVDWVKNTQGDVKTYEEGLRARADAYRAMLARMNEQAEFVKSFTPGRYAGMAGGVSAAVKDLGTRLPGIDKETVEALAKKIMGAKDGSPEALAAQQLFEQLAQQETLAQLKSSLGEGQRMNMAEYANFSKNNLGQAMDPETFKAMRDFYYRQAADSVNRYSHWADYVADPENKKPSVTGFDARYTKKEMDHYLSGNRAVVGADNPGNSRPTYGGTPPPAPKPAPVAPPAKPAAKPADTDLSAYEPGARVGPTGKVYVIEKGVPRPAQRKGAPTKGLELPVTLDGKGPQ